MDQKKRDKIAWALTIVLVPVLAYLLAVNVFKIGQRSPARRPASVAQDNGPPSTVPLTAPAVPESPVEMEGGLKILPESGLEPEVLAEQCEIAGRLPARNPFMPSASGGKTAASAEFKHRVTAIILSPGSRKRMAMVNGRMYEEGDRIGDWMILKVNPQEVIFDNGNQRMIVGVK